MRKKLTVFCLVALVACVTAYPALGQSLPKDKQAEVVFDLRLNKLRTSPLMQSVQDQILAMQAQTGMSDDIDIATVDRIFGAMSLPDSVADFAAMETEKELKLEFFARIQFIDEASADDAIAKMKETSETFEEGGTTYYRPPADQDGPQNMKAYRKDATTIEAGTDFYLEKGTGKGVFSTGLEAAWNKVPDHAIRFAIDLDNARDLINEAVEQAKQGAPPMMVGFIDLVNKASDVRISMDLSSDQLFELAVTGNDDDQAEELRKGLDGIMGMTKMSAQQMLPMLEEQDADAAKVIGEIINSLAATRDGTDVQIAIAKPAGFDEAIKNLIESMPGPGGDF